MIQISLQDGLVLYIPSAFGSNNLVEIDHESTTITRSNGFYILNTKFYFREYIDLDTIGARFVDVGVELNYMIEVDSLKFFDFNTISIKHNGLELGPNYEHLLKNEIINSFRVDIQLKREN